MVFQVSSSELLKKLQVANGAIGSKPVMPILEDVLFELAGNELTLSATNLEVTIISSLEVTGKKDGKVAIPAKILLETLKALPDQSLSFEVDSKSNGIKLKSAYGVYKLAGDSHEDFPDIPSDENVNTLGLLVDPFIKAINNTVFAASDDELRLAMTGVLMQIDFNKVIFVATDAHKLVKYTVGGINTELSDSIIIPRKGLNLFKNAISTMDDETASISYNNKNIFMRCGDTLVISRLIDAKYPDYNSVIPVNNNKIVTVNRADFQSSLRRIVIYSNKTTNQVLLTIVEDGMTISAQDLDFSNEATEQVGCSYKGDDISIGFNAKFLVEMLGIISTDEIVLELSASNKAGILLPSEQEEGADLMMLVMPVMMSH